jgi:hypothetical protein
MATFDVLAGRLTIDNTGFLNGLRAAGAAAQQFVANLDRTLRTAQQGIDGVTRSINSLKTAANGRTLLNGLGLSASKAEKAAHALSEALDETKRRLQGVKTAATDLGKSTSASRTLQQLEEKASGASRAVASLKRRIDGVTAASKRMMLPKLPEPESHATPKGRAESEPERKDKSDGGAGRLASDLERSERALAKVGKAFTLVEKMTARGAQWLRSAAESIQNSTKVQQALASIGLSAAGASEKVGQLGGFLDGFGKASETVATVVEWMHDALELLGPAMLSLATGFKTAGGAAVAFEAAASPLLTTLLPVAATIGAVVLAVGAVAAAIGLAVVSVNKAIERSEVARELWESITATFSRIQAKVKQFIDDCLKILADWWARNSEQIERIQVKIGELVLKLGAKLAPLLEGFVDSQLAAFKAGLQVVLDVASALLEAFEAVVDIFNGDWSRAMLLANSIAIEFNKQLIYMLELLLKIPKSMGGFFGEMLAKPLESSIASLKKQNEARQKEQARLAEEVEKKNQKYRNQKKPEEQADAVGESLTAGISGAIPAFSQGVNPNASLLGNSDSPAIGFSAPNGPTFGLPGSQQHREMPCNRSQFPTNDCLQELCGALSAPSFGGGVPAGSDPILSVSELQNHSDTPLSAGAAGQTGKPIPGIPQPRTPEQSAEFEKADDEKQMLAQARLEGFKEAEEEWKLSDERLDVKRRLDKDRKKDSQEPAEIVQAGKEGWRKFERERMNRRELNKRRAYAIAFPGTRLMPGDIRARREMNEADRRANQERIGRKLGREIDQHKLKHAVSAEVAEKRSSIDSLRLWIRGDNREGAVQGLRAMTQLVYQIKAKMLEVAALDGDAKKKATEDLNKLRKAFDNAKEGVMNGTIKFKDLAKVVTDTTKNIKEMNEEENEKAFNAKGQLSPLQQQQQQQAQQFQQQVGDWFKQQAQDAAKQMGQQAWESGQAMLEQALGGPGQVEDLIREATAKGDMKYAVQLLRQRTEVQLQQSMINLHNLASDPLAGGGFGSSHGGVSNEAYFMTLDIPLVRLIKFLQSQLAHLPKMAAGGIVSGAMQAVVGEAGPEAVLPLSSFGNMLGALPVFSKINSAMESISDSLAARGRTGDADRWDRTLGRVQASFDYVSHFVENARRIDLRPQGMFRPLTQGLLMDQELGARHQAYRIGGLSTGDLALHFHGVDISDTGAARQFAQQLLPALELEARSLGQDMTGRSVFRSPSMTGAGAPGRPYGFAR